MTSPEIPRLAEDLLQLAENLLTIGGAKASQATIRRSVSTAYYAVFHSFCELCADALVGRGGPPDAYLAIYRSLDHGPLKNMLAELEGADKSMPRLYDGFRELQDARHWADYNPAPKRSGDSAEVFPRDRAKEYLEFARATLATLAALDEASRLTMAAQLVGKIRSKSK